MGRFFCAARMRYESIGGGMAYYKVNMMGGFRVTDRNQVLNEGQVYEFSDGDVSESRGIAAALRERWLIETDEFGKPLAKAKPRNRAASTPRPPAEEADMYPSDAPLNEDEELKRVNAEELAIRFEDDLVQDVANEMVATPAGPVGPRKSTGAKPGAKPKKARKARKSGRRSKRKPGTQARRT